MTINRSFRWLLTLLLVCTTPIIIYYVCYQQIAFNETFYRQAFKDNSVYLKLFGTDIHKINAEVMNYLQDDAIESLQTDFFTANEKAHLADVKHLIQQIDTFALICAGVFLATIALIVALGRSSKVVIGRILSKGLLLGSILALLLIGALGIVSNTDFLASFTVFHEIFFPQGNYYFNPMNEKIVVLYPPGLFLQALVAISVRILIACMVIILVTSLILWRLKKT